MEIVGLADAYKSLIGEDMPRYFRFPEGRYNVNTVRAVSELGYKSIFWSFGYEDWDNARQPSEDYAIRKVLSNTHNGAVILLHPTSATNASIMRRLICEWRNMGYSFGTLDELTHE
jgi:peptidoglycan-N-acetylmuramic acid deacetylase